MRLLHSCAVKYISAKCGKVICMLMGSCRGCFDVCNDDEAISSPSTKEFLQTDTEEGMNMQSPKDKEAGRNDIQNAGESNSQPRHASSLQRKFLSGSFVQDHVPSPKKVINDADR